MENIVFIPVSDELVFDHPERIRGPLIPYRPGMRTAQSRAVGEVASSGEVSVSSNPPVKPTRNSHD